MLKVLVDYLISNWAFFLQALLIFIVTVAIAFTAGIIFSKNQNNALEERLKLRDDQLKEKDNEIKKLITEVEKIRQQKQTPAQNLSYRNSDYAEHLNQLSILELSKEAQKMANKIEKSAQLSQQRQDPNMGRINIEPGLYNEWLSEGPRLLAIKIEALNRLPDNDRFQMDQISDSRYTTSAFQLESIMDAVSEIKGIGLKLVENDAN